MIRLGRPRAGSPGCRRGDIRRIKEARVQLTQLGYGTCIAVNDC